MEQFVAANWEETVLDGYSKRRHRAGLITSDLVRRIAALKARAGCDSFPTDVDRLANSVGIQSIRYAPLAVKGRLVREPGGLVAEINVELRDVDRRFVLAHEIAHLIVERDLIANAAIRLNRDNQGSGFGNRQIEAICDEAAREIVLPLASLRAEIKKHRPSLKVVNMIADEAQCGLETVAHRICEPFGPWDGISFIWWKFGKRGAKSSRMIPDSTTLVELADEINSLSQQALQKCDVITGTEQIWVGQGAREFCVQVQRVAERQVLMLVTPRMA